MKASFVISAAHAGQYPKEGLPEAAFAGRSNVGKSSLINALLGRRNLAKISATPGKTRLINFFRVNDKYMFVDLPGYGYAKVPKEVQAGWRSMVEEYLRTRRELRVVVLLQDIRRVPQEEEIALIAFLTAQGIPPLVVLTKVDKLSHNKRVKPRREIAKGLGLAPEGLLLFSAHTGEGKDALWARLKKLLDH